MNQPLELEDQYVKQVLYNRSLEDLPDEEWKPIEGFEDYLISNYGRVKSLERNSVSLFGKERLLPELILKLSIVKQFNNYLRDSIYTIQCGLSREGKRYGKSVARLVYYHFIEKIDWEDRTVVIGFKDNNRFHLHSSNLEKISAREKNLRIYRFERGKSVHTDYSQPISQYTVEGDFVADFGNFYAVEKALGIGLESILNVINKESLTAGTFRWFLQSDPPKEEDFLIHEKSDTSGRLLNYTLWKKLGKPAIDKKNPPPCMNLSINNLLKEQWKTINIPEFKNKFAISNKGRIKRLGGWNSASRRLFLKEMIVSQFAEFNSHTNYFLCCQLHDNEKKVSVSVFRLLYYYFVREFDLNDETLIVINENEPKWDVNLSKLSLKNTYSKFKKERNGGNLYNLNKMRVLLNSGEILNEALWKKLGSPKIDEKNPLAIMNLSIKNLPNEIWVPLPGFEGQYAISNIGRIKRLGGWSIGSQFFGEEQIMPLSLNKQNAAHHLYFRVHQKISRNQMILIRFLYYCFVENFDLKDRALLVVNQNESLWDINLSKLSLCNLKDVRSKKTDEN
ncbi:NUMOD4 domain-containing protein [Chryseobacterium gregarium]|uniref:NUMOD4 domain-containing protein n=1 Tax=Chryseobacterium gregarium TaxID=456299 RepID=UPI0004110CFE|nr:NUMOD4 domain-containing protein [Chryseobacterium gregarium]